VDWRRFKFNFKQVFRGGYRYLDTCGALMLAAERELDFLPQDAKPTGCKMAIPEHALTMGIDSNQLAVIQELPEDGGELFFHVTEVLARLAEEHFTPLGIETNGYAIESFVPAASIETAMKESLKIGSQFHTELETVVGMPAASKSLDYNFVSGSSELHVTVRPVTFEKLVTQRFTAGFHSSETAKRAVERWNRQAEKTKVPLEHALMLMTDLMETNPPKGALKKQFDRVLDIDTKLKDFGFTK
jgi:hypothetical protein